MPDVNPLEGFGASGDGLLDDTAAIQAAVNAAAVSGLAVRIPGGTYRKTTITNVPAGSIIVGMGECRIVGPGFSLGSNCSVSGIRFEASTRGSDVGVTWQSTTAVAIGRVRDCSFVGFARGVYVTATSDNTKHTLVSVASCTFSDCTYGVYQAYGEHNAFVGNTFDVPLTGRAVVVNGGSYNAISGNTIRGGIAGIVFLYQRNVSGSNVISHNTVSGNSIVGVTEESITFDLTGNTAAAIGVFDRDVIVSKAINGSNGNVTLTHASFSTAGNKFVGYYAQFRTGNAAGRVFRIAAHANATLTLEMNTSVDYPLIVAGDEVVIGAPMFGNVVANNVINSSGTNSILLYGNCVGNTIVGNSVNGANIEAKTLSSLVASTLNSTGRLGRAPADNNTFVGNALRRSSALSTFLDFGSDPISSSAANVFSDNRVLAGGPA